MKHKAYNIFRPRRLAFFVFCVICYMLYVSPLTAHALEPQVEATMTVSAIVPSEVIKEKCEVYLNPTETLADPVSHKIFLKVTLRDNASNPLPNLDVWIWTNRREVDLIEILSGPDVDGQQSGPNGQGKKGKTDANGEISFSISSWMPGEAILYITADNLIEFEPQKIKFLSLPFPAELTLTLPLPFSQKEITLLSPQEQEQKLTPEQKEAKKLANIGTKITFPFWLFALIAFWIFITPLFIIFAALSLRRIRRTERREMMLLAAIAEAEHIDHVREFLKKEGIGK